MKIGDIKVGTEYAVTDGQRRTYHGDLPRRVTALAIETTVKQVWAGGGFTSRREDRNVRVVRVRVEDEPTRADNYYGRYPVTSAAKGSELVIEARLFAAPWSEVKRDVEKAVAKQQAEAELKVSYESRVKALLPKKMQGDHFYAKVHGNPPKLYAEMRLSDRVLDTILELAEKGAQE